jgi:hypothetical protein
MDQIPFPQANTFSKIIQILHSDEEQLKDNGYLSELLQVSLRQVNYYLSACEYLGIVKNRNFTQLGVELKEKSVQLQNKELVKLIIGHDIFFDVFYDVIILNKKVTKDEIASMIYTQDLVNEEGVADRRASTVKGWINWINTLKKKEE